MDLRIEKTRQSIVNAFIALRSRKPLEKITVKELCEKAQISQPFISTMRTSMSYPIPWKRRS